MYGGASAGPRMASRAPGGRPPRMNACSLPPGTQLRRVRRLEGGTAHDQDEAVAEEAAIALVYNGEPHVVMMATPTALEDFALGFSLSEGIVANADEVDAVRLTALEAGFQLELRIPEHRHRALLERPRGLEGRSSCGLCGVRSIDTALRPPPHVGAGTRISAQAIAAALRELQDHQPLNACTGAIHAAAWASADGRLVLAREDVGRHNALDKLIGAMAQAGIRGQDGFVVLTSRASYEMVLKSARAGIPVMTAISAPTSLAIDLADEAGITLIGFARDTRCTVYTRPARVALDSA